MSSVETLKGLGKLGAGIAIGLALKGDALHASSSYIEFPTPSHASQSFELERTAEQKHEIEIVSQEEAYRVMGIALDVEPARWQSDQIELLSRLLANLPKNLTQPHDGRILKIFVGNMDCTCGGTTYGDSGYIGFQNSTFNNTYEVFLYRATAHEAVHSFYFSQNYSVIDQEVTTMLGDREILKSKLKIGEHIKISNNELAVDALYGLLNDGGRRIPAEGVARIAELYIQGPDVFHESLGNYVDSNLFYGYWRETFFGGMDYNNNGLLIE